jgi:hypothetical protein
MMQREEPGPAGCIDPGDDQGVQAGAAGACEYVATIVVKARVIEVYVAVGKDGHGVFVKWILACAMACG